MLKIENLVFRAPAFEMSAPSLELAAGECAWLQGTSGSGKTTFLRALAGLDPIVGGQVVLHGRDIAQVKPAQREIGFVFQNWALFPALSVVENVAFGLQARGVRQREAIDRAQLALERVGLRGFGRRRVTDLSGGEQARVAWARALVWEPKLILLDEPFSALDADAVAQVCADLEATRLKTGAAVIFVSHRDLGREQAGLRIDQRWCIQLQVSKHRKVERCSIHE